MPDFPCLDAPDQSTLTNYLSKRDTSSTSKFTPSGDPPRTVTVDFDVESLWAINEKHQNFKIKFEMRMSWSDCKLSFDGTNATAGKKFFLLDDGAVPLWSPKLQFAEYMNDIDEAKFSRFWIITYFGGVLRSSLTIAAFKCSFDFTHLPFDTQHCALTFRPVKETVDFVILERGELTLPDGGLKDSQWQISDFAFTSSLTSETIAGMDVTFSQLSVTFTLRRNPSFYEVSIVLPTTVIWCLSYFGMFVSADAAPARAALALIPVLIVVNTQSRMYSGLPPISYLTRLDAFLMTSMLLLLLHLIEFSMLSCCRGLLAKAAKAKAANAADEEAAAPQRIPVSRRVLKWVAENMEWYFRIVSALAFAINLIVFLASPTP